ncbi:MAG: carbohydrate kinase family protein [Promethearchaeati archaeon SRVP18_Atabeyarchaeia-1]
MGNVVVALGDANIDICMIGGGPPRPGHETLVQDMVISPAGSTGYFSMAISKLGDECRFVGRLGGDYFGRYVLDKMKSFGITTNYVRIDPDVPTGVTVSVVSEGGERALVSYLGPTELFNMADIDERALMGARHLHIGGLPLLKALQPSVPVLFMRARKAGMTTSLDTGWDPSGRWDINEALQWVDIFLPNEEEVEAITNEKNIGRAASKLLAKGPSTIVIKRGALGCTVANRERSVDVPAFKVNPVDTTGAGDAFDAGFIFGFLRGKPLLECAEYGNAAGALKTLKPGCDGLPDLRSVESLIGGGKIPELGAVRTASR